MRALIGIFGLLVLSACAMAPTVYGPSMGREGAGYRDQKIEDNRYRVTFRAYSDMQPMEVEALALRRAAEIAAERGDQWFRVVLRTTEQVADEMTLGRAGVGIGGASGAFASGAGVSLAVGRTSPQYESILEVIIGRGTKPDDPDTYDVKDILSFQKNTASS